jgi:hypothetical protein
MRLQNLSINRNYVLSAGIVSCAIGAGCSVINPIIGGAFVIGGIVAVVACVAKKCFEMIKKRNERQRIPSQKEHKRASKALEEQLKPLQKLVIKLLKLNKKLGSKIDLNGEIIKKWKEDVKNAFQYTLSTIIEDDIKPTKGKQIKSRIKCLLGDVDEFNLYMGTAENAPFKFKIPSSGNNTIDFCNQFTHIQQMTNEAIEKSEAIKEAIKNSTLVKDEKEIAIKLFEKILKTVEELATEIPRLKERSTIFNQVCETVAKLKSQGIVPESIK